MNWIMLDRCGGGNGFSWPLVDIGLKLEFLRGRERLRRAVRHAEDAANPETRSNWLDLLVLR
jgi:hypothetical protein